MAAASAGRKAGGSRAAGGREAQAARRQLCGGGAQNYPIRVESDHGLDQIIFAHSEFVLAPQANGRGALEMRHAPAQGMVQARPLGTFRAR